jgi:hypothetical protein
MTSAKDRPFTHFAAAIVFGPKGTERLQAGLCPRCGSDNKEFKDAVSRREHGITGLCQKCQDHVFLPDEGC